MVRTFYEHVVKHRKSILIFFLLFTVVCGFLKNMVAVNYDMNDYLPEDAKSTVALNLMEQEFDGGIPNARVMVKDVSIPEALEYKEKLKDWYENIEVYESDENQNPILELDNICFSYNNEKQILKNVSFKINKVLL